MQECIAGPVRQCHKPETFVRVEPLNGRVMLRSKASGGWPRWCGPGHVAWRGTIKGKIVIEAAAPAWASAAAVGHVQEKIVPTTTGVVHGEPNILRASAGLLPHVSSNFYDSKPHAASYRKTIENGPYHLLPISPIANPFKNPRSGKKLASCLLIFYRNQTSF
jgi:hypothetical protein